jgi:release factor glutamine methyltransferase
MQIKTALKIAAAQCCNSSTPALDARIMLCHVLLISHAQLLMKYNEELSKQEADDLFALVKRRIALEPIAYIIGKQEFYGRDYLVNNKVLIPRPETELVIDSVINDYNNHAREIKILELGTGSGVIAITLAREILLSAVTAVDICLDALQIAESNAKAHKVEEKISLIHSNWYSAVNQNDYDYIISNPPYISLSEKALVATETELFEPKLALYAKDSGLKAYKEIINKAKNYLKENGKIFLEIGYRQKVAVSEILNQNGFTNIAVYQDLAGYDRVISACK